MVVATSNLAVGLMVGTVLAMIRFARRVAHFTEVVAHPDEDTRVYAVRRVLFLASSNDLVTRFDYVGDPTNVAIVLTQFHIWDA
ncbi:MAG TPA: hypothetical protein VFK66_10820 [Oryzihumus sp.]|nr:hypothetical protein [Oryzihumus sp.]